MLNRAKTYVILILMGISLVLLLLLLVAWPFKSPGTKIDLSRASVIKEINSLGNLETASYTIDKIVEAGKSGNVFSLAAFLKRRKESANQIS